jgi:hypothetical protein
MGGILAVQGPHAAQTRIENQRLFDILGIFSLYFEFSFFGTRSQKLIVKLFIILNRSITTKQIKGLVCVES